MKILGEEEVNEHFRGRYAGKRGGRGGVRCDTGRWEVEDRKTDRGRLDHGFYRQTPLLIQSTPRSSVTNNLCHILVLVFGSYLCHILVYVIF